MQFKGLLNKKDPQEIIREVFFIVKIMQKLLISPVQTRVRAGYKVHVRKVFLP